MNSKEGRMSVLGLKMQAIKNLLMMIAKSDPEDREELRKYLAGQLAGGDTKGDTSGQGLTSQG